MPFNGSGTYAAPALPGSWNPAVSGSSATPADWNTLLADLSTALSTCVTKDGQTTISADIPFNTHKITGLGAGTADTNAVNRGQVWYVFSSQDPSGLANVDFTSIPSSVANLMLVIETKVTTNASGIGVQTYGADGVLDTGGTDYSYYLMGGGAAAAPVVGSAANSASSIPPATVFVGNGTSAFMSTLMFANIQAATTTKSVISTNFLSSTGDVTFNTGLGWRNEADRITGIRVTITAGTTFGTGKMTLYASNAT